MCRILGFSMGETPEDLDNGEIAALLFPALVAGGPHAYGWMTWDGESIEHQKFPGRADTKQAWEGILEDVDPEARWMVGHTRFATHGSPERNINNHPVLHRDLIGVHNGVLSNHEDILEITGREDETCEVDSEAIFAAVQKWGPVKGLRRVKGSLVTVYADRRKPKFLYIGRSRGRQLTIGWSEKGNLFFASEQQALLKLQPEIVFTKFSTVSENRLITIQGGQIIDRRYFIEPKIVEEVRPKVWVSTSLTDRRVPASLSDARPAPLGDSEISRLVALNDAQRRVAERRGKMLFPTERKPTTTVPAALVAPPVATTKKQNKKNKRKGKKVKDVGKHVFVRGQWIPEQEWDEELAAAEARELHREMIRDRALAREELEDQHRSWFHSTEEFHPGIAHGD